MPLEIPLVFRSLLYRRGFIQKQFAIGYCRSLPSTASGDDGKSPGVSSPGVGGERASIVDPAGEIRAAIGSNNPGKYMVASQVCAISSSRGTW